MSEQKKEKKAFGVEECPSCDAAKAMECAGWGWWMLTVVGLLGAGLTLWIEMWPSAEVSHVPALNIVAIIIGSFMLLIGAAGLFTPWWKGIIGAYTYVFFCDGLEHHHAVAPLQVGTRWLAHVWDKEKNALLEKEITGPILRLAFGGWFKTCKVLNGWPQVKVGRPEVRTWDGVMYMFIPMSRRELRSGKIKETLALTPDETMRMIPLIGGVNVRVGAVFDQRVGELTRDLLGMKQLIEQSDVESARLKERNHWLASGLSFGQGAATVLEERLRAIVAAIEATKPVKGKKSEGQRSPVGQAAREAIEDTLWLVGTLATPHPDQPIVPASFDLGKTSAISNLAPLPAFVRPKDPPAESAAVQG